MSAPELFLLFVRPLNAAGIRYIVTAAWRQFSINGADIRRLSEIFPSPDFYPPSPEIIATEVSRKQGGHFNIIHVETGFKADLYPTGRDELYAWAFRLKREVKFEGETILLAPSEYVILRSPAISWIGPRSMTGYRAVG